MKPARLSSQPVLLACDTTQSACSVALRKDGEIISQLSEMTRGHAEALMPMIEHICVETDTPFTALERLAVTNGPGTFTGVRVGLSAMRDLALALNIPLCARGTLEAMAAATRHNGLAHDTPLIITIDARRDTYYTQCFSADGVPSTAPQALSLAEVVRAIPDGPVRVGGTGLEAVRAAGGARFIDAETPIYPHARDVLQLAEAMSDADWAAQDPHPEPIYLRPPDASLPDPDKRLRHEDDAS